MNIAAKRMAVDARSLSALSPVVVTRPSVKIVDEGAPGAPAPRQIEAHINRDVATYRALATNLASHLDDLALAARTRNVERTGDLINQLDGVCESCHLNFWYPEEKAFVEAFLNER